jgi:hypothetical protein
MKKLVMLPAMVLVSMASARAQEPQVGRYQMIAVPASQSQTFPETLLLDTASGQTWILYHETGQSIEWLPLRFWAGKDRPQTPCRHRRTPWESRADSQHDLAGCKS